MKRFLRWPGLLLLLSALLASCASGNRPGTGAIVQTGDETTRVARGTLNITVKSSGTIQPDRQTELLFGASGIVSALLVEPGDQVKLGQQLASLDTRDFDLQIQQAEANLKSAQARLEHTMSGSVTEPDVQQAEANVRSAQGQLQKAIRGSTTPADISSAEANLRSAKARLDALKFPSPEKVSAADLKRSQAQEKLDKTRTTASASKERAQRDLELAANAVRDAQDALNKVYWETHNGDGSWKLGEDDPRYQSEIDRYNQAVRDEQDAVLRMEQSKIALESAKQQEIIDVQAAEAQLRDAQQQYDALLNPSVTNMIESQAAVDQAQAQLNKLKQGGTSADIAIAQAQLDQARAGLEKLSVPVPETSISIDEAGVLQAEVQLESARLARLKALLFAPFEGMVTEVNIGVGDSVSTAGEPALVLVTADQMHVDVQVSEIDVAHLSEQQSAMIYVDALSSTPISGTVSYIAATASVEQNVTTYLVRVSLAQRPAGVRLGMSASIEIQIANRQSVLLIPLSALRTEGTSQFVRVKQAEGFVQREVKTGLSNDLEIEITSGLSEGDEIAVFGTPPTPAD